MDWPISWEDVKNSLKKKELMYEWNPGVDENGEPVYDVNMFLQFIESNDDWLFDTVNLDRVCVEVEYYPTVQYPSTGENIPVNTTVRDTSSYTDICIKTVDENNTFVEKQFIGTNVSVFCDANSRFTFPEDGSEPAYEYTENGWSIIAMEEKDLAVGIKSIRIHKVS